MRLVVCALVVVTSACSSAPYASRRPLSACAKKLVDERYLPEDETPSAVRYCDTLSTAQLECEKKAFRARTSANQAFGASQGCGPNDAQRMPVIAVTTPAVFKAKSAPAPVVVAEPPLEEPVAARVEEPAADEALQPEPTVSPAETDALMIAAADEDLSTFVRLLDVAGLTKTIQASASVTLLAPTNEALAKLPRLENNKVRLRKVLARHVLLETVRTTDAPSASHPPRRLKPLAGQPIPMRTGRDGVVTVGRAKVVRGDLTATRGSVSVIDAVLLP